ncbi:MAG: hypothetical protein V3V32_05435 [Dehalococcoidia bacterium]
MLFGIDAEYILEDLEGRLVSCHMLPSKGSYVPAKPLGHSPVIKDVGTYGCDGVFLEATSAPCTCRNHLFATLWDSMATGLRDMTSRMNKRLVMNPATEVRLSRTEMGALPLSAHEVGCVPSQNIYGKPRGPEPGSIAGSTRWTGLHLHFSGEDVPQPDEFIRYLDRTVGLVSVLMDSLPREAARRRKNYGEAGCFRIREGIKMKPAVDATGRFIPDEVTKQLVMVGEPAIITEYRVPSGVLAYFRGPIYILPALAKSAHRPEVRERILKVCSDRDIQQIINASDTERARELVTKMSKAGDFDPYISLEFGSAAQGHRHLLPEFFARMGRLDNRPSEYWSVRDNPEREKYYRPQLLNDLAHRVYNTSLSGYSTWSYDEKRKEVNHTWPHEKVIPIVPDSHVPPWPRQ